MPERLPVTIPLKYNSIRRKTSKFERKLNIETRTNE